MDRLLNISNTDGYPLCAETLELLHNNVQLLETVLNGLNLPQPTIVRFPYGNFAYVQSNPSTSGRGEILEIATGANLANDAVHGYSISFQRAAITDSYEHEYTDVYEIRRLNLDTMYSQSMDPKVYNFEELLEVARWKNVTLTSYINEGTTLMVDYVTGSPLVKVLRNDHELRIRICLSVENLPLSSNSEFRMIFSGNVFDNLYDIIPVWVSFNSSQNNINKAVSAALCNISNDNNRYQLKINTKELYVQGSVTSFTGLITVNCVISLDS